MSSKASAQEQAEDNLSIAAIVISLVALVVTVAQLWQQVIGTVEGYRRCQASVIGKWHNLVRIRWLWSEFRFETLVTTPYFMVANQSRFAVKAHAIETHLSSWHGRRLHKPISVNGSRQSRVETMSPQNIDKQQDTDDLVSWILFLSELHDMQALQLMSCAETQAWVLRENFDPLIREIPPDRVWNMEGISITLRKRSWDLMPPDIVRPLAMTNVSNIIILAHRMGMSWRDLRPSEGRMRAEGHGQSLSATIVRGLGIVIQYTSEKNIRPRNREEILASLRIPSRDADKLGCGIVPGNSHLHTWDIHLTGDVPNADPATEMIALALQKMTVDPVAIDVISASASDGIHRFPGFGDLIGLWSEWLPIYDCSVVSVIAPIKSPIIPMTSAYEAAVVWRHLLTQKKASGALSSQQRRVLDEYDRLVHEYEFDFFNHTKPSNDPKNAKYITLLKSIHDFTSRFFTDLETEYFTRSEGIYTEKKISSFYCQLIASHVSISATSHKEAEQLINAGQKRNDGTVGMVLKNDYFSERAFIYADNVPKIVEQMARRGYTNGGEVEDAWWTLMLRGQVWCRSVHLLSTEEAPAAPVPSYYFNSTTPVYIA